MTRRLARSLAPDANLIHRIHIVRGQKVVLDADLADLYGVTTKRFNEQVRRNGARFPADFAFQITAEEAESLRSQIATSKPGRGGRRYAPYAFTEHGAIMAATILNSPRATEVSVYVVRAFVELSETLATHKALAKRLDELKARIEKRLTKQDQTIADILSAIRSLMRSPEPERRPIGFVTGKG